MQTALSCLEGNPRRAKVLARVIINFNQKHDLFTTLTKCFLSLHLPIFQPQCRHIIKHRLYNVQKEETTLRNTKVLQVKGLLLDIIQNHQAIRHYAIFPLSIHSAVNLLIFEGYLSPRQPCLSSPVLPCPCSSPLQLSGLLVFSLSCIDLSWERPLRSK